ncbi:MAG: hypothetical protein AAGH99_12325 [Planctomycetota bacterium]
MSLTLSSITSNSVAQQSFYRDVNSTIQRLNAGPAVRPKDGPSAFASYQRARVEENRLRTAGLNAERAQAFGSEVLSQLDRTATILDEVRNLVAEDDRVAAQPQIDALLSELDEINAAAEFAGRPLFSNGAAQTTEPAASTPPPAPTLGGVQLGFANGDLSFVANRWKGQFNPGEFLISGSQFTRSHEAGDTPVALGPINDGVTARDNATGTGYILHSRESVYSRFAAAPPHPGAANNLVTVVYDNGQFYYDDNNQLRAFTPEADDTLIAEVDFTNDTISPLTLPEPATTPEESEAPNAREATESADKFTFATTPKFTRHTTTLTLNAIGSADLGTAENRLADLATGGELSLSGDRARAIETIDAAIDQVDSAIAQTQTFVRVTVGSVERANQNSLAATQRFRQTLENRAGQQAAEDARRLLLRSAGQSLVNQATQDQANSLLSLIESVGGSRLSRPRGTQVQQTVQDAQLGQLAEALRTYNLAADLTFGPSEAEDSRALPNAGVETGVGLGLDLLA